MKLTVMQWNVWTKEDPINIAREILRLGPDIVGAQELFNNDASGNLIDSAAIIAEITGYECVYAESETWDNREDKDSQGNAIFSKYPINKHSIAYLQQPKHNPPNAWSEGRVYVEANIEFSDITIAFGTTHLSFSHGLKINEKRRLEFEKLIKAIKDKQQNFILTGDFNAFADTNEFISIEEYLVLAGPDRQVRTWPTKPFNYRGQEEAIMSLSGDYVFVSSDIKVLNVEVIKTTFSDHLPVKVELEI